LTFQFSTWTWWFQSTFCMWFPSRIPWK
jgi:hypothetical protein